MPNKGENCLHSTLGLDTEQLKLARSFTFKDYTNQQPGRKTIPLEACPSQVQVTATEHCEMRQNEGKRGSELRRADTWLLGLVV